ncbi:hypothetical protein DSAG12_00308 [Promethearchaeum syntrophicum]|uniref:Uncharacterized protein n=1 Tax=Promethearchaeum syntrophicum TaxID=2594042 RepID=A0A5B9D667_9ARCH|nr:hypothetical protein [Candidatus Prometheoarchaeum syntrophicum]QEE14495.1 hypothetical protein DSAG12_00308 [Candidatus Prometheoarchaeum syntrophicum]
MGKKSNKMNNNAARRIQSSQDRKGSKGDQGFKSRSMSAASKNQSNKK